MKAKQSPWPRALAACVAGFLFVVASTTIFAWSALGPLRLRPLLVVVVSCGFKMPVWLGGLIVIWLGYLADLAGGGMVGLEVCSLLVIFVLSSLAQRHLEISSWPMQMVAMFVISLVYQVVIWGGLSLAPRLHLAPANLGGLALVQALADALTAPFFFVLLEALVRVSERVFKKLIPHSNGRAN